MIDLSPKGNGSGTTAAEWDITLDARFSENQLHPGKSNGWSALFPCTLAMPGISNHPQMVGLWHWVTWKKNKRFQ